MAEMICWPLAESVLAHGQNPTGNHLRTIELTNDNKEEERERDSRGRQKSNWGSWGELWQGAVHRLVTIVTPPCRVQPIAVIKSGQRQYM